MILASIASLLLLSGPLQPVEVHSPFVLTIEQETVPGQSVFVAADTPLLGGGSPERAVKLSPHDYPVWSITLDLPPGTEFQPVFLLRDDAPGKLGDAENVQILESGLPHRVVGTPVESLPWPGAGPDPSPPRTETFTFAPGQFRERTVRVLLPRGYDTQPERHYPLLLAQDGQNVFHPGGPFGSWDLDLAVSQLVEEGAIPEIILVGVDNSPDRFAEYIPDWGTLGETQGRGTEFLGMIRDELLPELETRYRLLPGPEDRAHIGSSLGGLLGWEAAHEFRDTFGTVAALSPSFQIATDTALSMADRDPAQRARLYIDSGTEGDTHDGYSATVTVRDRLVSNGVPFGRDFLHLVGTGHHHNEAAWRGRSPEVLRWMFPRPVAHQQE